MSFLARWTAAVLAPHLGERPVTIVQAVDIPRFYDQFVKAVQFPVPAK